MCEERQHTSVRKDQIVGEEKIKTRSGWERTTDEHLPEAGPEAAEHTYIYDHSRVLRGSSLDILLNYLLIRLILDRKRIIPGLDERILV